MGQTKIQWTLDQQDVKTTVERFLVVAGNYNLDAMQEMISAKANVGISRFKEGEWENEVITIAEYFEDAKNRQLRPYYEPVGHWDINEGRVAFVRADAILHRYGIPQTRNIDYFTLIKGNENWKFLNLSFTANPVPADQNKFDLEAFAKGYAQAWSGVRPEFVAQHFSEDGSLRMNEGTPARGRTELAKIAQGFMTDLPDMVVRFDSLVPKPNGTEFYWTLLGTNSGPGGTGNKINVSGYEVWQMGDDGLVKSSQGHFLSEEYNRQINLYPSKPTIHP